MSAFQQRKRKILASLSAPEATYTDLSPKGSIDAGIRDLVDEINSLDGLVTTSSCAGRIAIYVDGGSSIDEAAPETESDSMAQRMSSKGGGRWLFVSHDPLVDFTSMQDHDLLLVLGLQVEEDDSFHRSSRRLVHMKFEPMILHILCSSLPKAKQVLSAAMASGFRESGISSISDDHEVVMTAVRTNGLSFDSIIGIVGPDDAINLSVSPAHIRMLLNLSTSRFSVNANRTARFRDALLDAYAGARSANIALSSIEWEPADVRRARKKAEGLRLQQQKRLVQEENSGNGQEEKDIPAADQLFTAHSDG